MNTRPAESEFTGDVYHPNTSLVNNLRQQHSPDKSFEESDFECDNNDKFLEELEKENKMLEKELENLVKLKNDSARYNSESSLPSKSDDMH